MSSLLDASAPSHGPGPALLTYALVLARCLPWVVQAPFLGGRTAPPEVRMAIALLLALVAHPVAQAGLGGSLPAATVAVLFGREILRGFVLGYASGLAFSAFEMGGRLVDTLRGTSLAEVLDPHAAQRTTPIGDLHGQLFLAVFVASGAHRLAIRAVVGSFSSWPLAAALPDGAGVPLLVARFAADAVAAAVLLAAPVAAVTVVSDVAFGLLNRAAPQLNAWVLAMPLKALAAVALVALGIHELLATHQATAAWASHALSTLLAVGAPP
jgi:type III secretion protein SpaR/YscT/HrcT